MTLCYVSKEKKGTIIIEKKIVSQAYDTRQTYKMLKDDPESTPDNMGKMLGSTKVGLYMVNNEGHISLLTKSVKDVKKLFPNGILLIVPQKVRVPSAIIGNFSLEEVWYWDDASFASIDNFTPF
ncbi:MAG: hypothetical protein ACTSUV_06835 [Candidatus Ranarchaeia archaeon]